MKPRRLNKRTNGKAQGRNSGRVLSLLGAPEVPTLTQKSLLLVLVFHPPLAELLATLKLDPEVVLTPTAQRPLSSAAISSTARYVGINLASLARVTDSDCVHGKAGGGGGSAPHTLAQKG